MFKINNSVFFLRIVINLFIVYLDYSMVRKHLFFELIFYLCFIHLFVVYFNNLVNVIIPKHFLIFLYLKSQYNTDNNLKTTV